MSPLKNNRDEFIERLMENVKRTFRDRDYIKTVDGFFFTAIGNVHPEDSVLAYLKYLPNPRGKWRNQVTRYARSMRYYSASNAMKTIHLLKKTYPEYVFNFEPLNLSFSAVPLTRIARHYLPEEHLRMLRKVKRLDVLQQKAVELALMISDESGVSLNSLGITGSILIDIHNVKFSDIDLVVYGRCNSLRVKKALLSLYSERRSKLRRLEDGSLSKWCKEQASVHPLSLREIRALYSKKWNKGMFKDTIFSIHPVKVEEETMEKFGDEMYVPQGHVDATARILKSEDSYFLPSTYIVDHVTLGQANTDKVLKIVSFEGLYADIATRNDQITVRGTLEDVLDKSGYPKYQRIVVGSQKGGELDFMKVVTSEGGTKIT